MQLSAGVGSVRKNCVALLLLCPFPTLVARLNSHASIKFVGNLNNKVFGSKLINNLCFYGTSTYILTNHGKYGLEQTHKHMCLF